MTFLVDTSFPAPLANRVKVVNLHVTTLRAKEFEKAYCALISSPSLGIVRRGGSTRSTSNPCAIEFTTDAISASKGSFGLEGWYSCTGSWPYGVYTPEREGGRAAGVRVAAESLKLDGGVFCVNGLEEMRGAPW